MRIVVVLAVVTAADAEGTAGAARATDAGSADATAGTADTAGAEAGPADAATAAVTAEGTAVVVVVGIVVRVVVGIVVVADVAGRNIGGSVALGEGGGGLCDGWLGGCGQERGRGGKWRGGEAGEMAEREGGLTTSTSRVSTGAAMAAPRTLGIRRTAAMGNFMVAVRLAVRE